MTDHLIENEPFDPDDHTESNATLVAPALYDLGVRHFEADFEGSGDEGLMEDIRFYDSEWAEIPKNRVEDALKALSMPRSTKSHYPETFRSYLEYHVNADADGAGFSGDGDGGRCELQYTVTETGIYMTSVENTYYEPDYDDDEDIDEDFDDEENDLDDVEEISELIDNDAEP